MCLYYFKIFKYIILPALLHTFNQTTTRSQHQLEPRPKIIRFSCLAKLHEDPRPCVSPLLEQLESTDYCGLIKDDDISPFRYCLAALPHLIKALVIINMQ